MLWFNYEVLFTIMFGSVSQCIAESHCAHSKWEADGKYPIRPILAVKFSIRTCRQSAIRLYYEFHILHI
uniref:Putative secreted protein n=1 Tax=Xenopsylla cheopis TaxID=163159 RepID=A0A6M2DXV3_XENCH